MHISFVIIIDLVGNELCIRFGWKLLSEILNRYRFENNYFVLSDDEQD